MTPARRDDPPRSPIFPMSHPLGARTATSASLGERVRADEAVRAPACPGSWPVSRSKRNRKLPKNRSAGFIPQDRRTFQRVEIFPTHKHDMASCGLKSALRFRVPMRVQSWSPGLSMNRPAGLSQPAANVEGPAASPPTPRRGENTAPHLPIGFMAGGQVRMDKALPMDRRRVQVETGNSLWVPDA
jgi:hypothetical protein